MKSRINVAIAGCGAISHAHVSGVKASGFGNLALVMDSFEPAAKNLSQQAGVPYTTSYQEILDNPDIDAVIVASPHYLHAAQALAAAKAKKHVYLEKPMALSNTDAAKVIDTAKKNKVKLMVGHNYRYKPGALAIKKVIESGVIGEVYEIRMQFVADIYQAIVPGKWREDPKKAGGGSLLELGIHEIDMLRYWLGKEPERVYAEMNYKGAKYPTDRLACVMVEFPDTVCYIVTGYKKRNFYIKEIHGENGSMTISAFPDRNVMVYTGQDKGRMLPIKDDPHGGHQATMMFIESIAKDTPVPVPGEDGKKSNDIMLAAYLSAKEKRVVKMPLKEKVSLPL